MESFVYDCLMADNTPIAVCVLCADNTSGYIKSALKAAEDVEFGDYRSGYTIDYRLSNILKDILLPFEKDILFFGATVEVKDALCPTGGIIGAVCDREISSEREVFSKDGFTFVTEPGQYAFAIEGEEIELLTDIKEKYLKKANPSGGYINELIGISVQTEMIYDALMKSGKEFILISDGSGKRMGAAAVRGNIVSLAETKIRTETNNSFFGLKKIGVIGGTFDPIHNGHLTAAENVREALGLDKVIFMPTGHTPYKKHGVSSGEYRYIMARIAAESNEYFCVSSMETSKSGFSYTADTICQLRKQCDSDAEIYFITGTDVIEDITRWKDFDRLSKICCFAAVTRPGYEAGDAVEKLIKDGINIKLVEAPALEISSSMIRRKTANGTTIKYLLPEAVEKYIKVHGLYRQSDEDISLETILKKLI